jgi:hypothetical protein
MIKVLLPNDENTMSSQSSFPPDFTCKKLLELENPFWHKTGLEEL